MLKRVLKILGIIAIVLIVSFLSIRYYAYNVGKRDIQSEEPDFSVSSAAIVTEFSSNATASNKKYLEKPVSVSGIVTSINDKEVILDNSVNCNFSNASKTLKKDQKVTVKGRVVGYDDLLGEVRLDQCNLSK
ncbi:MAG: OB-fold protein [Flavobacterium sp.]|uniref:OB-fold protein n=1 Tax=Flavobacterium sp. TaxID=239 RepID=UPI003BEA51EE